MCVFIYKEIGKYLLPLKDIFTPKNRKVSKINSDVSLEVLYKPAMFKKIGIFIGHRSFLVSKYQLCSLKLENDVSFTR